MTNDSIPKNRKILPVEQIIEGIDISGLTYVHRDRPVQYQVNASMHVLGCDSFDTPFSRHVLREQNSPELLEILSRFKRQIVIELGAGPLCDGFSICKLGKAKKYAAIEPFHPWYFYNNLPDNNEIPVSLVCDDALTFLRRIPDNSISIWMAGVEENVIHSGRYWYELESEIDRVLHPDGGFIEYVSGNGFWNLKKNLALHKTARVTYNVNCWVKE